MKPTNQTLDTARKQASSLYVIVCIHKSTVTNHAGNVYLRVQKLGII
jgi:hypothetical protein